MEYPFMRAKINPLKKTLSYFLPLVIETAEGRVTPYLEVMMTDGKLVLNSQNANYSYDSLHRIFKSLFHKIELQKYSFKNILILGMGGGKRKYYKK